MQFDANTASRAVLIEAMNVLGAFRDKIVIVGGSVPELLYPNRGHAGTLDVDLAVSPTALGGGAYETILKRLTDAGYTHQINPTRFLKHVEGVEDPVKLDLISGQYQDAGKVPEVQIDELQISTLCGLDLAFEVCREIEISGPMPDGTQNTVRAKVVEPQAFILIKAFALDERLKEKDAYDIVFVLRNFQPDIEALAERLRPLLKNGLAREGYKILKSKFDSLESVGPSSAARVYEAAGENFAQSQRAAYEYAQDLFRATDR
jgi:hypothetical protein